MSHKHKLTGGQETGKEQIEDNPAKHFHMLNGDRTSSEGFDEKHTHTINGDLTGPPIEIEGKEMRDKSHACGVITKFAVEDRPEGQFGVVEGYAATFDTDRGDMFGIKDQFVKGAFLDSIADHLQRRRDVRLLSHHKQIIGRYPIESVREDERGLFVVGEINLEVQEGREIYSLVKQGAISDFSIGFSIDDFTLDGDLRTITKATIWEFSLVSEPMNPHANITDVKNIKAVVPYQDLPLAERDKPWDASAALGRVRELTNSEEAPSKTYKKAFVWFDRENDNTTAAYKLPVADVVEGKLTVIPRAVFAAASDLSGVSESDRPGVIRHLEKYYAKMDIESPFKEADKQYFTEADVKEMSTRELEKALKRSGAFSKKAAKLLVSKLDKPELTNDNDYSELLESIKSIKL